MSSFGQSCTLETFNDYGQLKILRLTKKIFTYTYSFHQGVESILGGCVHSILPYRCSDVKPSNVRDLLNVSLMKTQKTVKVAKEIMKYPLQTFYRFLVFFLL